MRMDEPAFDQDGIGSWRTGDSVRLGNLEEHEMGIGELDSEDGAGDFASPQCRLMVPVVCGSTLEDVIGADDPDLMEESVADEFEFDEGDPFEAGKIGYVEGTRAVASQGDKGDQKFPA